MGGVAVAFLREVGRIGEAHRGLDDVADGLDMVAEEAAPGLVETIKGGVRTDRRVPVVEVVEACLVAYLFGLRGGVPTLLLALHVGASAQAEGGRDVDVFEQLEVGIDGDAVVHAVAPVAHEAGLEEAAFGGGDGVGDLSGVGHGDFLIPPLFAHGFAATQGIEAGHGDGEVGQGHVERVVAHVLRDVGGAREAESEGGDGVGEAHRRGAGGLGVTQRVVHRVEVAPLVVLRGKIDARREGGVGVGLGVGRVVPLHFEARLLGVVGHVLVARHGGEVRHVDIAAVAIAVGVVALGRHAPGPFGVEFAEEFEVHAVGEGEVVAAIAQVETAGSLFAVGGHDESRRVGAVEGEKSVGNGQWQWNVGHNEIGRTEKSFFPRTHFRAGESEAEVGVVGVAGGVLRVLEVEVAVVGALRVGRAHEAFALGGLDVLDEALFRLEVERHVFALVLLAPLLVNGLPFEFVGERILHPAGVHEVGVEVHPDVVGREGHVLIVHLRVAVEMGKSRGGIVDEGVGGGVVHRRFKSGLSTGGVGRHGVGVVKHGNRGVALQAAAQTVEQGGRGTVAPSAQHAVGQGGRGRGFGMQTVCRHRCRVRSYRGVQPQGCRGGEDVRRFVSVTPEAAAREQKQDAPQEEAETEAGKTVVWQRERRMKVEDSKERGSARHDSSWGISTLWCCDGVAKPIERLLENA